MKLYEVAIVYIIYLAIVEELVDSQLVNLN